MRWILLVLGAVVVLVVVLVVVGFRLPRGHRATSRIRLRQPPDSVWRVLRDIGGMAAWWADMKQVERLPDKGDGKERWRENLGGDFSMVLVVEREEPPGLLRTVIEAPATAPFGGSWTYRVIPDGTGSRVEVTEDGWISNPVFRVVTRLMGAHRSLDGYLRALSRRFGESAEPEHAAGG
jgi:uncharacterized protein YndB with AHSA1/START domain